jgi:hypothetical protein
MTCYQHFEGIHFTSFGFLNQYIVTEIFHLVKIEIQRCLPVRQDVGCVYSQNA